MRAHNPLAGRDETRRRLVVAAVALGLVMVPLLGTGVSPRLASPFVYPGLRFGMASPYGMASPLAWVILGLFLASAVLLLVRWDVGTLTLAGGLLAWGLWQALQGGWLSPSFWGLVSPVWLVAGTLLVAFRSRGLPRGSARRCPACGTVQAEAGGHGGAVEAARCELCGFDLPPAPEQGPGVAGAGPRWGHVSVAVFFGALGLFALGALVVLAQFGGRGRMGMSGMEGLVLGGLALAGWVFGAAAGLVGWARARRDGRESIGWGVGGAVLNLAPLVLPLLFVASVRWRDFSRRTTPPAGRPPLVSPVKPAPPPAPRAPIPSTREAADAQVARAEALLREGRDAEAERTFGGALLFLDEQAPGEERTWQARLRFADAQIRQKKYQEAEATLRSWHRRLVALYPADRPEWGLRQTALLDRLADVCEATGRRDEAARLRAERARPGRELAPLPREAP